MKKLPFSKMLFLTLIAFFTFNTLNATSSSSRGFNYDMPRDYSGQMYTALLRCGVCGQSDLVEYHGYYMDNDKTYIYVLYISCQMCGSQTRIHKMYHKSDLDVNKIVEGYDDIG